MGQGHDRRLGLGSNNEAVHHKRVQRSKFIRSRQSKARGMSKFQDLRFTAMTRSPLLRFMVTWTK